MKKKLFVILIAGLLLITNTNVVMARQENGGNGNTSSSCDRGGPLAIPSLFRGLTESDCSIKPPSMESKGALKTWVSKIIINASEILLRLAGIVALLFVIFGGFKYMTAQGSASRLESAKKTITRAIGGLVIAVLAVTIVNFISKMFN